MYVAASKIAKNTIYNKNITTHINLGFLDHAQGPLALLKGAFLVAPY